LIVFLIYNNRVFQGGFMALQMKYFVLKPRGSNAHAEASRCAMMEYSRMIQSTDKELAASLVEWAHEEKKNALLAEDKCAAPLKTKEGTNNARDKICPSCHGSGNSYCGIGLEMGTCLSCNGTGKLS